MARPKGSHDIAPQIRGAFIRAVKGLEDDGKPLSAMIREHLESDFLNTLKVIASFVPKEMLIEGQVEHNYAVVPDPISPEEWQTKYAPSGHHSPDHKPH